MEPGPVPRPPAFLTWAKQQGIHVTLNIHASIADNDPQLAATQALAGGSLADSSCFSGGLQGLGLEQHPAGRVLLRPASAVRVPGRVVLVAGLVL